MRLLRSLAIAGIVALSAVGLTGCDHWSPDPIAVTRVGDSTVVRLCLPTTITAIRTFSGEDTARAVWEARGELQVEGGAELALGDAPAGWTVTHDDRAAALTPPFRIRITATDDFGDHTFTADVESALVEGVWLDGYGEATDTPCTREPCTPGFTCLNQWPQPTGAPTRTEPTWTPPAR